MLGLLFGFTACNEEDILKSIVGEAEAVPLGTYVSQCIVDTDSATSSIETLILSEGSFTLQINTYSASIDCMGTESIGTPSAAMSIDFSGIDLGDNVSYFTDANGEFVPFFSSDGSLALGDPVADLSAGANTAFEDFIADFENNSRAVYTLQ